MSLNEYFIYAALTGPTEIRGFLLSPDIDTSPILGSLQVIDLDRKLQTKQYTALSYLWGDQAEPEQIFIDGHPFFVGKNLAWALKRLRGYLRGERNLIWADAVCINQADIHERESQVKLMGRVYEQATRVIGELGHRGGGEAELEGLIEVMVNTRRRIYGDSYRELTSTTAVNLDSLVALLRERNPDVTHGYPTLDSIGLAPKSRSAWTWWRVLIDLPYFRRIWIRQEFSLPSKMTLLFGELPIEADDLSCCAALMYLVDPVGEVQDTQALVAVRSLGRQRAQVHHTGAGGKAKETQRLLNKLRHSRRADATDLRDKIYGMLNMASDEEDFLSSVSYAASDEMTTVVKKFARLFVEKGQAMKMLYQVDSRMSKTLDIPSWVPDWSRPPDEYEIGNVTFGYISDLISTEMPAHLDDTGCRLVIQGAVFDTIDRLSTPLRSDLLSEDKRKTENPQRITLNMFHKFGISGLELFYANCHRFRYDIRASPTDAFLETLVRAEGDSTMISGASGRIRQSMLSLINYWNIEKDPNRSNVSVNAMQEYDMAFVLRYVLGTAMGRSFCVTSKGNFGLMPGGTSKGDCVTMIQGSLVPFVLRPVQEAETTVYKLMGHGYLHGLSKLDAVELRLENKHLVLI